MRIFFSLVYIMMLFRSFFLWFHLSGAVLMFSDTSLLVASIWFGSLVDSLGYCRFWLTVGMYLHCPADVTACYSNDLLTLFIISLLCRWHHLAIDGELKIYYINDFYMFIYSIELVFMIIADRYCIVDCVWWMDHGMSHSTVPSWVRSFMF
jgi:hypothetical protein